MSIEKNKNLIPEWQLILDTFLAEDLNVSDIAQFQFYNPISEKESNLNFKEMP